MRLTKSRVLDDAQVRGFVERGWTRVPACVPLPVVEEWVAGAWRRLGASPRDPSTWKDGLVHLPFTRGAPIAELAPKAWGAICDALGGEERVKNPAEHSWGDTFIVNFPDRAGGDWIPRSGYTGQWHLDGENPRTRVVRLDSADLALISMVCWTAMGPGRGGTEVALDSLPRAVDYLAAQRHGATTPEIGRYAKLRPFERIETLEGEPGDVILMSPYLVHRSAPNASRDHVRILTTQMHAAREPLRVERGDGTGYSPVEASLRRALGKD